MNGPTSHADGRAIRPRGADVPTHDGLLGAYGPLLAWAAVAAALTLGPIWWLTRKRKST